MAYDEALADRIRAVIAAHDAISERKMFGGLAFMIGGNMACGIVGSDLMVRVGPEHYEALLAEKGARPMDFTGRPMKGMLYVDEKTVRDDVALTTWVERGAAYAGSLPAK